MSQTDATAFILSQQQEEEPTTVNDIFTFFRSSYSDKLASAKDMYKADLSTRFLPLQTQTYRENRCNRSGHSGNQLNDQFRPGWEHLNYKKEKTAFYLQIKSIENMVLNNWPSGQLLRVKFNLFGA